MSRNIVPSFFFLMMSLVVGLVSSPLVAQQPTQSNKPASLMNGLIEAQGLDRLPNYWRVMLRTPGEDIARYRAIFPTVDVDAAWRVAVDQVLGRSGVPHAIATSLAQSLSEREARELIAFRRTALGKKITAAEVKPPFSEKQLSDPAYAIAEMFKTGLGLEKDSTRKKLIMDILQASGGAAAQIEPFDGMLQSAAASLLKSIPHERDRLALEDAQARGEMDRAKLSEISDVIAMSGLALTYKNLSNAELRAYLSHILSPIGQKSASVWMDVSAKIMRELGSEIGKVFGTAITVRRS